MKSRPPPQPPALNSFHNFHSFSPPLCIVYSSLTDSDTDCACVSCPPWAIASMRQIHCLPDCPPSYRCISGFTSSQIHVTVYRAWIHVLLLLLLLHTMIGSVYDVRTIAVCLSVCLSVCRCHECRRGRLAGLLLGYSAALEDGGRRKMLHKSRWKISRQIAFVVKR